MAPKWNNEFELRDGSYSLTTIKDYIKFITKKLETLSANPLINIYINRINYRIVFKINDGYKLELRTPETMKLFSSTKKLIGKIENGEAVLK